jgi:transcriptional regulator with XRE-family HTH domain
MVEPPHLGSMLQARRVELGFTLRDVEQITGGQVSNAYLSQLENGKIKNPSLRIMCALAAAYAVSLETLREWLDLPAIVPPTLCPTCGRFAPELASATQQQQETGNGE